MCERKLKILEFYSGIGGMHYALKASGVAFEVLGAFDINTNANDVYKHNFPNVKIYQKNLEGITSEQLDKLDADCWTMSPPCQPYTRQGKQEASKDARAKSFLHLLDLLLKMKNTPMFLLLENVKGFEQSDTREMFVDVLKSKSYSFKEFLLTPTDFGIPNSRLRYYLVAKLRGDEHWALFPEKDTPIEYKDFSGQFAELFSTYGKKSIAEYLDDNKVVEEYLLKPEILLRFYPIMDIVQCGCDCSCCFTKAYSKYIEGTGSILTKSSKQECEEIFKELENINVEGEKLELLLKLQLQYFSPKEVARLLVFPITFTFPASTTLKQKYQLLGNSVNVFVISMLMKCFLKSFL